MQSKKLHGFSCLLNELLTAFEEYRNQEYDKNWQNACVSFTEGVYFTLVYLLKPPRQELPQSLLQDVSFLDWAFGLTQGSPTPPENNLPAVLAGAYKN